MKRKKVDQMRNKKQKYQDKRRNKLKVGQFIIKRILNSDNEYILAFMINHWTFNYLSYPKI